MPRKVALLFVLAGLMLSGEVRAQAPPPFGPPINLEDAKKVAAAAVAEVAKAGSTPDSIAIVDHGGFLIHFERMDNASLATVEIAIAKARSAALFRRPTKVFEDALAGGRNAILALHGAVPIEGGVPIISSGKIVGAIGASGARLHRTAK